MRQNEDQSKSTNAYSGGMVTMTDKSCKDTYQ